MEVRLGETDIRRKHDCIDLIWKPSCVCEESTCPFKTDEECLQQNQCAPEHIAMKSIKEIIVHPKYDAVTWVRIGYLISNI